MSIASGGSSAVHVVAAADVDRVDPELAAMTSSMRSRRKSPVAHGPRYATYVPLLLKTAVWCAEMASILVGPWNEPLSDIT